MFNHPLTRSSNGVIAGVCQGLAERMQISVGTVRVIWLLATALGFAGGFAYLVLAICLPTPTNLKNHFGKKLFGVCYVAAKKWDWDLGLTRALFLLFTFLSFGLALVVYVAMIFILPVNDETLSPNSRIIDL